ncbi:MAG: glycoside hydrolase family 9 protein [Bacteroidales bacterium]
MKKILALLFALVLLVNSSFAADDTIKRLSEDSWIRINQAGYLPQDIKVAVFMSLNKSSVGSFSLFEAATDKEIFSGTGERAEALQWGMQSAFRFNFSSIEKEGGYYIVSNGVQSPIFKISAHAYDGLADFLLEYMRQQRCGDNPYTGELCHQYDGFIVDHPTKKGERVDVRGGWHDATDYLQYTTTSATSVYHMMFAWEQTKDRSIFKDRFDAAGRPGANGIPDILDEIRWGLEWLVKMNPQDKVMFNQIADDRDHAGFRLPQNDTVNYGWGPGKGRPVYFVTGKPQGLGKHVNRTTGVASTAGKFSSSFALGAQIFSEIDPQFAAVMREKSLQTYSFAVERPGNTQTACLASPYFYEEDSYVDDIELAAATIYYYGKEPEWRERADYWGELEPVSPWMELGRGRHYQFYPFINLGHFYLATSSDAPIREKYLGYMRDGLEHLRKRADGDPFIYGVPFLWCSNNLVSAAITHAHLYREASGDDTYLEMETALRDWLFGTNPWGTSMIVGFPEGGVYPLYPHSSYTVHNGDLTYGGLLDGPIERELFLERAGNSLTKPDEFALFNNGKAVYHDDIGDYASNEPTMDGTAGLSYYLSAMEALGKSYREKL